MNLQSTDFELFGLPERFAMERAALDARWKQLQREAHPDRFVAQGDAALRVATQWSVRINEAYQRLKNPLSRAAYLCELRGAPINAERNTAMPGAFLMQQMQWREALDDARSTAQIDALLADVQAAQAQALDRCAQALDSAPANAESAARAAQEVRALMFIERMQTEALDRRDTLGQ
jgi:molecular chaperone HscB